MERSLVLILYSDAKSDQIMISGFKTLKSLELVLLYIFLRTIFLFMSKIKKSDKSIEYLE